MKLSNRPIRAFTIIELLVVVSIIALLVSVLLPAIGKARDQAKLTLSIANLRNLGTAHAAYAANYNDRQVTFVIDGISDYGPDSSSALNAYAAMWGPVHPNLVLGWGPPLDMPGEPYILWQYHLDGAQPAHASWGGNPITMGGGSGSGFGQFRFGHQLRTFNDYLNGRYYDPIFFAPKEVFLYEIVKDGFESPAQFAMIEADDGTGGQVLYTSSYALSPAAMYSPDALKYDEDTGEAYTEPWSMPGGLRCPAMSQALYPNLKTHMLEHGWLQNRPSALCNPAFVGGTGSYQGCEPYYFNHAWESQPATLFFDGHVEMVGVREAMRADGRAETQSGYGLWSRDTPLGTDGYYIDAGYDQAATSFHILTVDGIRGRDLTSN
ncbi:MAG: type II secretion system protein [Phycisphaerales bacterium]|nr:type II secretion system GspH family protein [Phycisphaerae bacterium]NNF44802.1 type II secretion system protein [Phycisphaerales bacterium]NNM27132.1 type II secretion system protein [Phycisphaerales bacterium]